MQQKTVKFVQKMKKKYPHFVESIFGLSLEDLEKNLLIYSKHRADTEYAKKHDEELINAKAIAANLAAPYNDTLGALKDKLALIHILLKHKDDIQND